MILKTKEQFVLHSKKISLIIIKNRGRGMAKKYQNSLVIIGTCIAIVVCFTCFWLGYQNYLEPKLGDFHILEFTEENREFVLKIEESHNAVSYETVVRNEQGEEIYKTESETTTIILKNLTANYGETLKFQVKAKNKNGTEKAAEENYEYIWKNASFKNLNSRYLSTSGGLSLLLLGYQQNETYELKLEYLNQVILEETIKTDNIYIPYQKLEGYAGRITAKLYTEQGCLISTYNFYINTPVVGKIKLTSPSDQYRTRWNDIKIKYQGGENATEYHLLIFKENELVNTIVLSKETQEYTIPAEYLEEEKNYFFSVEAVYLDYSELTEWDGIDVYVGKKEETNPVYVSHNPTFIKAGTEVTLATRTKDAQIYYTLDGSDPTPKSLMYQNPIKIDNDTTIKAIAVSKNRYDSAMNTYDFQVREKQLVVYLSPSNQYLNYGVSSVGYTSEMKEMNKIADVVERVLRSNGVTVYRNSPSKTINDYLSESNYVKSDLHLAIHSNAATTEARGMEIYVDKPTSKSLSIATNIYQNLYSIYPGKNLANTDRGVKYANGSLGEANDSFIPCGTLIEIAYHDNYEDAKWIVENRESIGNNIAQSILSYYN